MLGELLLYALGVRALFIHLVYSNYYLYARSLCVVDRFYGLRHDTVVRRYYQHRNIGDVSSACSHRCESFMARGIEEGYLAVIVVYLIRAYVLGYAARLAVGDMRVSYPIEYRGLAVVNVAHYYFYGAALFQRFGSVLFVGDKAVFYRYNNFLLYLSAQLFRNERSGVEVDSFVEGSHYAQTHQLLDDLGSGNFQSARQL